MYQNDMQGAREANAADMQHNKARGAAPYTAAANHSNSISAAVGPDPQVTLISNPITPKVSGKFRITAQLCVNDATVDDPVSFSLVRDPTSATGAPGGTPLPPTVPAKQDAGHTSGDATVTLTYIDAIPLGSGAHVWGITALSAAGHNLTLAAGTSIITLEELPG